MTALLDSMSYADMAAIVVAVAVTATAGTVLWLLNRCTLRTCAAWALCLLIPLTAACEDPDPCDPTCPPTDCGEVGCDGS